MSEIAWSKICQKYSSDDSSILKFQILYFYIHQFIRKRTVSVLVHPLKLNGIIILK